MPRIRGIGTTGAGPGVENPVAIYVDGVYIASARQSMFALAGVERVEVLKGPQGTLFGRNATGGLIHVITKAPRAAMEGDFNLSYGNYDTLTADAFVGGPLTEGLGATLTMRYSAMGEGYGTNVFTGEDVNKINDDLFVRGKLVAYLGEAEIGLAGDYGILKGSVNPGRLVDGERNAFGQGSPNNNPWDISADFPIYTDGEGGGTSLTANVPVGFAQLQSITSYRASVYDISFDGDTSSLDLQNFAFRVDSEQFSQELQISSLPGQGIAWVAGAYYYWANDKYDPVNVIFGPMIAAVVGISQLQNFSSIGTDSISGYGQVTIPLGDRTNVTGGLRYTSEKRTESGTSSVFVGGAGPIPTLVIDGRSERFEKLTFRAAIDHKIVQDVLAYASFNRGFKSGGYNPNTLGDLPYEPEVLDAYEVGLKSDLFGRTLRLNIAGFYYDYSNIQVSVWSGGGLPVIRNGAKARVYGLDADFSAFITERLRVTGGASVLNARFSSFPNATFNFPQPGGGSLSVEGDASGNRLPMTPDWTANLAVNYTVPLPSGRVEFDGNYYHSDGFFGEADNLRRQEPFDMFGASVTWHGGGRLDGWRFSVWGRNLTNEAAAYVMAANNLTSTAPQQPPRTYGATLGYTF
jgi:outer membrane receptor protein involved in Fe transport